MSTKSPDPYDIGVGKRIRFLRMQAGLSQEKAADAMNLTFQQMQKYEKGVNRIAPSRLNVLAKLFKVPVAVFFGEEKSLTSMEDDFATLLATRKRQQIFRHLVALDDAELEALILTLIEHAMSSRSPKRKRG